MTLYQKIITIHSSLSIEDFSPRGTIIIQDDSDGKGEYIKEWNHPTLAKPTEEQLGA
jgi:hypothetical protein